MKKWGYSLLFMLFFLLVPGTKTKATEVICINADGTCHNGSLSDDRDDVYYFDIEQDGWVRIGVSSSCRNVVYDLKVNSPFGYTQVSTDDDTFYLGAGTYYVSVKCNGNDGCGSYQISANHKAAPGKDIEPNNYSSEATLLKSGTRVYGTVYNSASDVDWYKFEVKTKSWVHFSMDNVTNCYALVYDETLTMVNLLQGNYAGGSVPFAMNAGTYYIQVYPKSHEWNYGGDYNLNVTVVEYPTPNEVTNVETIKMGQARVTWSKSEYADGYYVFKKSAGGSWYRIAHIRSGETTSYVDYTAPTLGGSCIYGVQAYRWDEVWAKSSGISGADYNLYNQEDSEGYVYSVALSAPKNVKVSKAAKGIKVTWGKVENASGYKVFRSVNGKAFKEVKTIKSGKTLKWTDTAAAYGGYYKYVVKAYYATGTDALLGEESKAIQIKRTGKITKPSGVSIKEYAQYNQLSWKKVEGAVGYKVYRKVGSSSYKLVKTFDSAKKLVYKDKDVKKGKKYTYKVKAYYEDYTYQSSQNSYKMKIKESKYSKTVSVKR